MQWPNRSKHVESYHLKELAPGRYYCPFGEVYRVFSRLYPKHVGSVVGQYEGGHPALFDTMGSPVPDAPFPLFFAVALAKAETAQFDIGCMGYPDQLRVGFLQAAELSRDELEAEQVLSALDPWKEP